MKKLILLAAKYLIILQKWCLDRAEWIRAIRATMPDEDKYRAVGAFHHAQADCAAIQALIDRLTFSREQ